MFTESLGQGLPRGGRIPPISQSQWLCATVYQEASGEPFTGKLGVAYVVLNRAKERRTTISDIVLKKMAFSCWNSDSPTRNTMDTIDLRAWEECAVASEAALGGSLEDPTQGANHYLNERLTIKIRGGSLPAWYDPEKVTVRIGQHTFLKL